MVVTAVNSGATGRPQNYELIRHFHWFGDVSNQTCVMAGLDPAIHVIVYTTAR